MVKGIEAKTVNIAQTHLPWCAQTTICYHEACRYRQEIQHRRLEHTGSQQEGWSSQGTIPWQKTPQKDPPSAGHPHPLLPQLPSRCCYGYHHHHSWILCYSLMEVCSWARFAEGGRSSQIYMSANVFIKYRTFTSKITCWKISSITNHVFCGLLFLFSFNVMIRFTTHSINILRKQTVCDFFSYNSYS